MPKILNPVLYKKAKEIADNIYKKSSAFKSGFIQKKYKELGGKYIDDGKEQNLTRWFKENWKDIGGKDYPVFRPHKRINNKTPKTYQELNKNELKAQINLKQRIKGLKNLPPFK